MDVGLQTHYLVDATFALAVVTVLAVLVPLIVSAVQAKTKRKTRLLELVALGLAMERRLVLITADPKQMPKYDVGASVQTLAARVYSNDIAEALPNASLAPFYTAFASATEALMVYGQFLQETTDPLSWSSQEGMGAQFRVVSVQAARDRKRVQILLAAQSALEELRAALATLRRY